MSQAARTTGPAAANVDLVTDFLAVGGDLAPDDLTAWVQATELVESGVSHVLDVRLETDDAALWAERGEVRYRWDGIDDAGQTVPGAWFDRVAAWALDALATPGARLLTHCHMGVNRGPSAGYAVLLTLGWDPVDALAAIRAARPVAGIAYAEDALEWWLDRTDVGWFARRRHRARVQEWRTEHPLDVERVIRRIRAGAPLALGA